MERVAYKVPTLMDDGPSWIVKPLLILEQNRQEGYSGQEGAAPELQDATAISTGAFRRHHQHGEPSVLGSAHPADP